MPDHHTFLLEAMSRYQALGRLRFHVPGHAAAGQGLSPLTSPAWADLGFNLGLNLEALLAADLTELEGLDVLGEPSGCIKDAQTATAQTFGVAHSFFLVNGSSVGIMAGMLACLQPGDKILLPRNVHRSVINGLVLTGAEPVWCLPDFLTDWGLWAGLSAKTVEAALRQTPKIRAVLVTSPTYEGLGSDVLALAQICHQHKAMLLVDEAHGALWPFSERLPLSACQLLPEQAADLVIQSTHKTAGSLTQSALAHLPHGSRLSPERLQQALNTLQTTSPSYLLMASLDATQAFWASATGKACLETLLNETQRLRHLLTEKLQHFELFTPAVAEQSEKLSNLWKLSVFWDPTKLFLRLPARQSILSGEAWAPWLEADYGLAYEAASPFGALYLCQPGLSRADYDTFLQRLLQAESSLKLKAMLESAPQTSRQTTRPLTSASFCLPEQVLSPREAFFAPAQAVEPAQAVGKVAQQTVAHCPPGVPVLLPGERITPEHAPLLPNPVWVVG